MITVLCALLSVALAAAPTPSDILAAQMILAEVSQDGERNVSASRNDPGQCRRFQADVFADVSAGYYLTPYPDATLFLPTAHADRDVSGRPVGTCWDMPDPETGNAFVEVARFDYDRERSHKENLEAAKAFLSNVRAGDLMQMLATYSDGNRGTHTLLFTRPYDPRLDTLYWVDSNFANRIIDGVRHGIVRGYQGWPLQEVAGWLAAAGNNGATLYRLSGDIAPRAALPQEGDYY